MFTCNKCSNNMKLQIALLVVGLSSVESRNLWEKSLQNQFATPIKDDLTKYQSFQISGLSGSFNKSYFSHLQNTTEIRIISNRIKGINPGALCSAKNLKVLEVDFSGNLDAPTLEKSMFEGCLLQELFLKFDYEYPTGIKPNCLEDLSTLQKLGIDSLSLRNLSRDFLVLPKNLNSLELSNIHVVYPDQNIFYNTNGLTELKIVHNLEFTSIPENFFQNLSNLKELSLRDNGLKTFSSQELQGLSSLEELDLTDNQIESLDANKILEVLPNLKKIFITLTPIGLRKDQEFFNIMKLRNVEIVN